MNINKIIFPQTFDIIKYLALLLYVYIYKDKDLQKYFYELEKWPYSLLSVITPSIRCGR